MTAFFTSGTEADVLRAYNFINNRFVTTPAAVSAIRPVMTGGPSVSANGSDVASGIVWAVTTQASKGDQIPGTLRAFRASDVSQEIYNTDMNSARDALGDFTRFAPPVVANGKVYVATQSKAVSVYGLLCGSNVSSLVSVDTGTRNAARNNTYTQTITVRNTSSHAIGAPFDIALDNLTPGRHSDQRDGRDFVRRASRKSLDPIDRCPALACAGRFLYGRPHIHSAFERHSLQCARDQRLRRPVVSATQRAHAYASTRGSAPALRIPVFGSTTMAAFEPSDQGADSCSLCPFASSAF